MGRMALRKILILVTGDKFFTNSADGTIKVWDVETCTHVDTIPRTDPLQGKDNSKSYVSSWAIDEEKQRLFAGYSDGRIRIWSLISPISCIATRDLDPGHPGEGGNYHTFCNAIGPMVVKGNEVFFGCAFDSGSSLRRWDCESNTSQVLLGRYGDWGRPMAVQGDILFSGFGRRFKDVRICTINNLEQTRGTCSVLIRIHNCCMRELYAENGVVFSSADNAVKILDFTEDHRRILKAIAEEIAHEDMPIAEEIAHEDMPMADERDSENGSEGSIDWYGSKENLDPPEIITLESESGAHGGVWYEEGIESCLGRLRFDRQDENAFYGEDISERVDPAIKRFSRMPQVTQQAIFEKLDEILRYDNPSDYNGCPADAFYGRRGQSATSAQKAKAIFMYLDEQPSLKEALP